MTGWLIETLIASTLLMAAVLLLRAPVRRAFGAQLAYALWALPVLRLVLPPMPASWHEAAATPITRAGETIVILVAPVIDAAPTAATAAAPAIAAGPVLAVLWFAGALVFLGWHALAHRRFCRRVLSDAVAIDDRGGVRVVASATAPGPVAFGVWRRYVAFPRDFGDRYDVHEQELALDHELGHHARGDLIANWIALGVLALHWFNPVAWRAFRAFRADQELATDARVLAGRSRTDRHIYACAIVKAAHGGAVSAACHLHTIEDLKGRLKMLTVSRNSRRRLATGAATVAVLGMLGLGLTISGSQAAAAISERVEAAVQATPAPPAPPAVPAVPAPVAGTSNSVERTTVVRDGKTVKTIVMRSDGDGKPMRITGSDGSPLPPGALPAINIVSGNCGAGNGTKTFVIRRKEGNSEATVICTDRIETAAKAGTMTEADGNEIERQALTAALSGLQSSRASIAGNASMTADQKSQALTGIDEAIAEIKSDLADVGKD